MYLKTLHIVNYRNIAQADIELSDGINCFVGINGAGKTNLLDTVYYMSFCKSLFTSIDSQNIKHDEPFFVIQGQYGRAGADEVIYCGVKRGQKKQFKRNKKDYQRLSEHIGLLPLVIIAPMDELLISDGSEERRKYADGVISQCDKPYLDKLLHYSKLLQQRNALLKQLQESASPDLNLLDAYDVQLAALGDFISASRRKFVEWLRPMLSQFYTQISSNVEEVDISYVTGLDRYDLYSGLRDSRSRDLALGYTSRGIHRDDIEFSIGGYPIKRVGSQGQRKSFVIALKLAQFQYLRQHNDARPLLLLDDVFDKLDATRGDNLIELVADEMFGQIFITDTNRKRLQDVLARTGKNHRIFSVSSGMVLPVDELQMNEN